MADLAARGLVDGVTGRNGGHRLSAAASEISLLMIVEAVEGASRRETCVLRGGPCWRDDACAVRAAFRAAEGAMIGELDSVARALGRVGRWGRRIGCLTREA